MSVSGTIVSHDPSLHTGLVMPDGSSHAIKFTEGDVLNWNGMTPLFGQRVSFSVVQTPQGFAAIHMLLAPTANTSSRAAREWTSSIIAPLIVVGATYGLTEFLSLPMIMSFLFTINVTSVVLAMIVASRSRTHPSRPAEFCLIFLAFCGAAPAVFLSLYLLPTRLRNETTLTFLGITIVIQLLALYKYYPDVYDLEMWRIFLSQLNLSSLGHGS